MCLLMHCNTLYFKKEKNYLSFIWINYSFLLSCLLRTGHIVFNNFLSSSKSGRLLTKRRRCTSSFNKEFR